MKKKVNTKPVAHDERRRLIQILMNEKFIITSSDSINLPKDSRLIIELTEPKNNHIDMELSVEIDGHINKLYRKPCIDTEIIKIDEERIVVKYICSSYIENADQDHIIHIMFVTLKSSKQNESSEQHDGERILFSYTIHHSLEYGLHHHVGTGGGGRGDN